jgi:hypothetical protein
MHEADMAWTGADIGRATAAEMRFIRIMERRPRKDRVRIEKLDKCIKRQIKK